MKELSEAFLDKLAFKKSRGVVYQYTVFSQVDTNTCDSQPDNCTTNVGPWQCPDAHGPRLHVWRAVMACLVHRGWVPH